MQGWLPLSIQIAATVVLIVAVGWRSRRWRTVWLPVAAAFGAALTAGAHWFVTSQGLSDEPAPTQLWVWTGISGAALALLVLGWRATRWWRRGLAVLSVPLCALCAALALNLWVGYFPNVETAWGQVSSAPVPDETKPETVVAMQKARQIPRTGQVVPVQTGWAASGFKHRDEFVYLPPAWFASSPPPKLPTLMMIGGEFNTPADWLRAGNAIKTADDFAAAHHGNAPVMVFVDSGGAFNNDTECVNGPRGNAADHLTKDVVPFLSATYGVSTDRRNWGIVGWSMGGTCAVDLAAMHPDLFSAFEDIAGDIAPNAGTRTQTIQRLFGGNASRYADFDPMTVIARHTYNDISAWYDISGPVLSRASRVLPAQTVAANSLCRLGTTHGMHCVVVEQPGKHDWPFAAQAFTTALPWLAGQVGTPEVLKQPLPGATAPAVTVEAARR
ncbi:alpha/beta hydrolase-fold protein [Mycobacterium sp. OTB74]|uniref:alpha/beta hydrolase n=1 Tax=Mycobacterium sp. OTB74 TaxID=1853452 RepID=UPI0024745961|nr:alpha/beta hydrolase-fold protein [Mycobacterium sp. OTB74]MDH6247698.1 S-formylglutathione hydrolase FrmB [Mycobacterium sp. OTB74]